MGFFPELGVSTLWFDEEDEMGVIEHQIKYHLRSSGYPVVNFTKLCAVLASNAYNKGFLTGALMTLVVGGFFMIAAKII